jgi:CubicO group peptidase (beta-lactamase class C family)
MKRIFKYFLILVSCLALVGIFYLGATFPPILAGFAAKTMCSCTFVMGRTQESVVEKELTVFPGLSTAKIEFIDSAAVTGQFLWSTRKAIYREGLGCTLLSERTEAEVRNQKISLPVPPLINQDSIPWPSGNLSNSTISGVDYSAIRQAVEETFAEPNLSQPKNTHAVVVVYKGQIVGEKYANGFDLNTRMAGWSMTKSLTNGMIGLLIKEGKLTLSQSAPVAEWQNDERKNITINDLMHASSGLEWNESYFFPGDFHNMFMDSDDKGGYYASKQAKHKPNEFFEYSSGATNLLSKIIRQSLGDSAYHRFPYEKLFYKIGMYHTLIEPDASGTYVGSSYGHATARDWARFGLLYLNDGVWNGERILPEGWVKYSSTPASASPIGEYGAQFWLNAGAKGYPGKCFHPGVPNDEFGAEGFEEQNVFIIPSQNLVIVRLGISHHGFDMEGLTQKIIAGLPQSDRP